MKRSVAYVCGVIASAAAFSQAVTTIGCNTIGDVQPTDASAIDVTKADAAPPACGTDPPPVMKVLDQMGNLKDGDWSCYGDAGADAAVFFPLGADAADDADADAADADMDVAEAGTPDAGDGGSDAGATCNFKLTDFVLQKPVNGAAIDLLFHNDPSVNADFSSTTDSNGAFPFPVPGTELMGYRIKPGNDIKALVWLDTLSCRAGQTYQAQSITKASFDLLSLGFTNGGQLAIDPEKMTLVVGVRDCQYRDVVGGIVQIFDDTTGLPLVSGKQDAGYDDFRAAYFGTMGTPDIACTHTSAQQALYAAINVPTDRPLTVRASGRMSASDTSPVMLKERKLPAIKDTIVIVRPYKIYKQ